ncbi:uncharacterized protein BXZ73DRAFT_75350 [Epithele typhae]|uniref:uncharacterized protein n=1 Tax=Epithele typhae TaxID=378194 RepID=UPI002007D29C|nr:uncharacterized protein BXZ73DRAFT_75350 [Epithele typhae]KAH9940807.1 hypothetical protein BXZ73DRAFT_75350 [Epithele typhae]
MRPSMKAMAVETQDRLASTGSTATLDLQEVLSTVIGEPLLSTHLSLPSVVELAHPVCEVPPFPSIRDVTMSVHDRSTSDAQRVSRSPVVPIADNVSRSLITLPTGPRLKVMMVEKISIRAWTESVCTSFVCDTMPKDIATRVFFPAPTDEDPARLATHFSAGCDTLLPESGCIASAKRIPIIIDMPLSSSSQSTSTSSVTCSSRDSFTLPSSQQMDSRSPTALPSITLSTSTAALPLTLDSPPNNGQSVSLAVRRGKKSLPALSLDSPISSSAHEVDSYPDIPSAFLGSPTLHSPSFPFSSGDPSKFNMGLSAMCNNLKSLVPPPPFSPTEPSFPLCPTTEPKTRWGTVNCAQLSDEDDEWAFAQDLVAEWHASRAQYAEVSPPPSPIGTLAYSSSSSSALEDGSVLATSISVGCSDGLAKKHATSSAKQMRRKTVIIQAPDNECRALAPTTTLKRAELARSRAADWGTELFPDYFDDPVPFVIPARTAVSSTPALNLNPTNELISPGCPLGSVTARVPVRGILKERKNVRFSVVPSLHDATRKVTPPLLPLPGHHERPSVGRIRSRPDLSTAPISTLALKRLCPSVHTPRDGPQRAGATQHTPRVEQGRCRRDRARPASPPPKGPSLPVRAPPLTKPPRMATLPPPARAPGSSISARLSLKLPRDAKKPRSQPHPVLSPESRARGGPMPISATRLGDMRNGPVETTLTFGCPTTTCAKMGGKGKAPVANRPGQRTAGLAVHAGTRGASTAARERGERGVSASANPAPKQPGNRMSTPLRTIWTKFRA